jgi:TolB-like protein
VPGLYVIADGAVQPYAGTELAPSEVGELLGARGLVDASVKLVGGRVLVDARLRETATGTTLWQAQIDRPVDELRAVRDEMADGIAGVMLDPGLRAPPAIGAGSDDGVSASKPFQQ